MIAEVREVRNGCQVVTVTGKISAVNAAEFEGEIMALAKTSPAKLVLDLSPLEYISSGGLRIFLLLAKKLKAESGELRLCSIQENVHKIFKMAGFLSFFTVSGSIDEAVASIKA